MTLDIRGSLKNTRKSKNALVVIDELLANSIDAFLIRRSQEEGELALSVILEIKATKSDLLGEEFDLEIVCKDNGCGLGPDQLKAFLTKDTSYKDDLNIPGIGNCKGSGRVQYYHHFSKVAVSSVYAEEGKLFHSNLPPIEDRKEVDEGDFEVEERASGSVGTMVALSGVLPKIRESIFTVSNIYDWLQAEALKQYVLFSLLQRLVSLREVLGDFQLTFKSDIDGSASESVLAAQDLPEHDSVSDLEVIHVEDDTRISANLTVTHYKLEASAYDLPQNIVGLCAKSAIAENIVKRYLATDTLRNNAIDGFYHIVLVEGPILDEGVNEQRDGFDKIPEKNGGGDLFVGPQITFEDIYVALDDKVRELLAPPDWSRDKIVEEAGKDYGVSEEMLSHSNVRVSFGDSPSSVAKRVLRNLQEKVVDETTSLISMKEEINQLEPDSDDFRRKLSDLSWQFTASLRTIDMANLSQLVVRRSNVVDVLDLAVNKRLAVQNSLSEGERRKDEELIHNIFFPMRMDSEEVEDHDVWLLSEEYHYYDYISSDKPLSAIKWADDTAVFDSDIDDALSELMAQISNDNSGCRPDIALFHEEGSVVIVELKAPGVSIDEHENELFKYATVLASKSNGKLRKFYGYIIGDTINPIGLRNYNPLPGAKGYFTTSDLLEPTSRTVIGQLYSEVLHYEDIVERARKRIGVYREKLGLPKLEQLKVE
ncbi:hypothetical protein [Jannaschia sp. M317]|uniref:hypothetical protein n=1 Tax=Jannaschia sp. M317 TaxID=2867011 RepID=UPI0021A4285D|nr:hypothetical protein [Jannaschia sp. M317]UWQ17073.1 hypothetical protein K3551_14430 [Jannaschia sp. M317]